MFSFCKVIFIYFFIYISFNSTPENNVVTLKAEIMFNTFLALTINVVKNGVNQKNVKDDLMMTHRFIKSTRRR